MGMGKLTYEECRQRRLEENKKHLEDLNLLHLSQVRLIVYARNLGVPKRKDLSDRVYASDEARAYALEKAAELVLNLDATFPILIRSMLPSHVNGGFWLVYVIYAGFSCSLLLQNDIFS
ncbi:hypothetical protein Ancab_039078 [Ancistrocladus abbreviatus]